MDLLENHLLMVQAVYSYLVLASLFIYAPSSRNTICFACSKEVTACLDTLVEETGLECER